MKVVGISPDSITALKKFDDTHSLGFSLLSDPDHRTAEAYGTWGEKSMYGKKSWGVVRSAFLVDEKGTVVNAWYKISSKDTVPAVMTALKEKR